MTKPVPYRDPSLPVEQRVEDLLGRMSLEEKAGQLFQTMIATGALDAVDPMFGLPSAKDMVVDRNMTHFNLLASPATARELAEWHNEVQAMAAATRLGIPVTLSSDPRNAFSNNPLASLMSGPFSQWPETLGLAALRDPDLVERFADIVRQEYVAAGLRVALHPQIDVATEPRWGRTNGTFGEDADVVAALGAAYVRGLQGPALGSHSVAAMVKHFPGGGPQKDGEDPHFAYGREQVYPGDNFAYHLRPFEAAFAAGASQVMPYYGMPVGTEYEEVGFSFNKAIVTELLRGHYGFDGIVCTDWGLITDTDFMGAPFPARAWGVENLSRPERAAKILDAGCDQFGGEACPEVVIGLVEDGTISVERIDVSVRRLLREKFVLGLFDDPYVDVPNAEATVGRADFREAGETAQRDSLTLLSNADVAGHPALPLARDVKVWLKGVDAGVAGQYATVVQDPAEADVAVVRMEAAYTPRTATPFESFFHAGSLEYTEEQKAELRAITSAVPTVVDVYLDRPVVLGWICEDAAAVVADYGASDAAVLDVLFGVCEPKGRLPFDIPSSMKAVEAAREDVPFDTAEPTFHFGHGLSY